MPTTTDIRNAVKALLLNRTDAGDRISTNRSEQIWRAEIPCIVIYSRRGSFERISAAQQMFKRVAMIDVELVVEQESDSDGNPLPVDDSAEALKQDVLNILLQDHILGDQVEQLNSFEPKDEQEKVDANAMRDPTGSGIARPLAAIILSFEATWDELYVPDMGNLLDEFLTADVKINTPPSSELGTSDGNLGATTEETIEFERP